jgi:flagellar hook-associated protein 2
VVQGVEKRFSALATVGITQDVQGHLQIDDAALTSALNDNLTNVSRLFASDMRSDSSYVSYLSSSSATQPSPATGWNVNVTQAARQAQVTAGVAMTGTLGADETLTIYADASRAKDAQAISLSHEWTLSRVIEEINAYSDKTGVSAVATKADGTVSSTPEENTYLTLRSTRYGAAANVYAYSSLSNSAGGTSGLGNKLVSVNDSDWGGEGGTGQGLAGLDVAGTINGEACKGAGQMLTANPATSNNSIKGFCLLITSAAPLSTKVYFTKGIGTLLRDTLVNMTSLTGTVTAAQDSINTEISDLNKSIADMEQRLTIQEEKLYAQFNAMESQLAKLQEQGNYLTQQLAALNK